jgi:putative colanic acid biosynthesis acetyltransferase WcaF
MINLARFSTNGFDRGVPASKEACWWLVRCLLFAHSFPIPSPLKTTALRLFGARIGRGVVIRSRVNITFPWRFQCGDHVWIGDEVMILSLDMVTLGSSVCISQRSFLCTGSHDFEKESFDLLTAPISVGDSVWIGASSFVGPGVQMGTGSRCLAGAVVVRNVADRETVGGVPARPVNQRGGLHASPIPP